MKKLINLLRGYVEWRITGPFPERMLNLCAQERLPFWRVRWLDANSFTFRTPLSRARQAEQLAGRAMCQARPLARRGAGAAALALAGRWGFLAGLALCIAAAGFLSNFLLEVQVTGNETVSEAMILSELSRLGVRPGAYGPHIQAGEVANEALLALPDLAYMAVNIYGTRAVVSVREAVKQPELLEEDTPANVVAAADGIILSVRTEAGRALVQAGDIVAAGETLITGVMELEGPEYSDAELGSLVVHAAGSVRARTWRRLEETMPLHAARKVYTGNERTLHSLKILWGRVDFFQNSSFLWSDCDKITEEQGFSLAGHELPVGHVTTVLREYRLEAADLDPGAVQTRLEGILRARLDEYMAAGDGKVLRTDYVARIDGERLIVTLLAECEEEIARTAELPGKTGRMMEEQTDDRTAYQH